MNANWIKLDVSLLAMVQYLPAEMVGNGMISAVKYCIDGEIPCDLDATGNAVFQIMRKAIDASEYEYTKASERNKERANKRWSKAKSDTSECKTVPPASSGIKTVPLDTSDYQPMQNRIDIDKNRIDIDKNRIEYAFGVSIDADADTHNTAQAYISKVYPFLTPGNLEVAAEWCARYPFDLIKHMVDITADKRSFRYLEKAMMRLDEEGITTLDEVKAKEAMREAQKRNMVSGSKPNPALQYEQRPADDAYTGFEFVDLSVAPNIGDV